MRIERLTHETLAAIIRTDGGNGWKHDLGHWSETLRNAEQGKRLVVTGVLTPRWVSFDGTG